MNAPTLANVRPSPDVGNPNIIDIARVNLV